MMDTKKIEAKPIDDLSFQPFGFIIKEPDAEPSLDNKYERTWAGFLNAEQFSNKPLFCYMIAKQSPLVCETMECLIYNSEAYINIERRRTILFVAPDINGECNEAEIRAFLLDKGESVVIAPNVWHYMPIPIDGDTPFLMILANRNLIMKQNRIVSLNPQNAREKKLSYRYVAHL